VAEEVPLVLLLHPNLALLCAHSKCMCNVMSPIIDCVHLYIY
jgi:hypothetical protein